MLVQLTYRFQCAYIRKILRYGFPIFSVANLSGNGSEPPFGSPRNYEKLKYFVSMCKADPEPFCDYTTRCGSERHGVRVSEALGIPLPP